MSRRVLFFLIAGGICLLLAPVAHAEFRWVAEVLAGTYGVLALLAFLDDASIRRHARNLDRR